MTEAAVTNSPSETPLLFISYATEDAASAGELRQILIDEGYRTWIAPDDIRGSRPWAEQILDAIAAATVMVVLVSSDTMRSSHVGREVNVAFDHSKAVLPIRIEDVALSGTLQYLLALVQWVDAFPPPLRRHHDRLSKRITDMLNDLGTTRQTEGSHDRNPTPPPSRPTYRSQRPDQDEANRPAFGNPRPGLGGLAPWLMIGGGLAVAAITVALLTSNPSTGTSSAPKTTFLTASAPPASDAAQAGEPEGMLWRVAFDDEIREVAVDGRSLIVTEVDGTVHAVDAATGLGLWKEPFEVGGATVDLVTSAGRLFFVRDRSRLVYCVDTVDGVEIWRRLVPLDAAEDRPRLSLAGSSVLVGLGTGVTSLGVTSGSERWVVPDIARLLVDSISAEGSLVAAGDGRWLYALDASTGDSQWELGPPDLTDGAASITVQQIEVQSGFGSTLDSRVVVLTGARDLLMLDGETGVVRWTAPVTGYPAATAEAVYVAGVDGYLQALNSGDGTTLWTNDEVMPSLIPVVANEMIYTVDDDMLIAVNPRSGTEVHRLRLGMTPTFAPQILGELVVVSSGRNLFALIPTT
ncbi:MAG TPA: PQQ-binding-like beta-propeller repeat protein [Acidimicrobiia bacterium]|nr:PQQ-binding-like beta-propeller repeat protein [Acidimicrobiia bacterium]